MGFPTSRVLKAGWYTIVPELGPSKSWWWWDKDVSRSFHKGHSQKKRLNLYVIPQGSEASMSYASALNPKDFWGIGRSPTWLLELSLR